MCNISGRIFFLTLITSTSIILCKKSHNIIYKSTGSYMHTNNNNKKKIYLLDIDMTARQETFIYACME